MKNLNIIRIEEKNLTIREMSDLEMYGAVAVLTQLLQNWYEEMGCEHTVSFESVDRDTFYCGRMLYINDGYILNDDEGQIKLTSVFCVENNKSDLFGYAEFLDEEGELRDVLVRI